jgi:hypothetical protein
VILEDLRRQRASWVHPESPEKADAEFQTPTLKLTEVELAEHNITASSAGVFVHFEEYEARSYAEGDYVVLLPWNNLETWIRPEVVEAFKAASAPPGILSRRPLE